MLMSITSVVFASTNDQKSEEARILELFEKHDAREISARSLPQGIEPIVINTLEDLETFIAERENRAHTIEFFDDRLPESRNARVTGTTGIERDIGGPTLRLNTTYEYLVSVHGIQGLRAIQNWWSLTGFTLSHSLSSSWAQGSVSNGVLRVQGTASVNTYLLFSGAIRIITDRYDGSFDFRPMHGVSNARLVRI